MTVLSFSNGYCHDYIEERARNTAEHIISTGCTVRQAAKAKGTSKSTVFKDVCKRLPNFDAGLALKVKEVLDHNLEERHIRGGMATKRRWLEIASYGRKDHERIIRELEECR